MEELFQKLLTDVQKHEEQFQRQKSALPCKFALAQVTRCTQEFEPLCSFREDAGCPKRLLERNLWKKLELREQALRRGIPERVLRNVFDQVPNPTPAMQVVERFMKTAHHSVLVLSGPNACGKTTAAAWACIPPIEASWVPNRPGRFVRLVDLESAGRFSELLSTLRKSPLVVLDDLGAAHFSASGFLSSLIDDVVDAAYQACHKVILTTDLAMAPDPKNPNKPCLAHLLSKRVMSRIKDAGHIETKLGSRFKGKERIEGSMCYEIVLD